VSQKKVKTAKYIKVKPVFMELFWEGQTLAVFVKKILVSVIKHVLKSLKGSKTSIVV